MASNRSSPNRLRLESLEDRWNLSTLDPLAAPAPEPVAAHVDYFLKLDGIDGESTDSRAADVITYTYTVTNTGSPADGAEFDIATGSYPPSRATGGFPDWTWVATLPDYPAGGDGAGKVAMQDFHFVAK